MLKSVNHCSEFILNHLSWGPLNPFTLLGETEIIHLGIEEILMMNIAMSSSEILSSEGRMNTQLGGGRRIMQLREERMNTQLRE